MPMSVMADATEQKIIEAATQVFITHGYSDARMEDIAKLAGINKALLHYYFRTKKKLFQLIARQTFSRIVTKVNGAIEQGNSTLEMLEGIVSTYVSTIKENPNLPIFVFSEVNKDRVNFMEDIKRELERLPNLPILVQQIMLDMEAGVIRRVHPIHLIMNVMSLTVFPFLAKPVVTSIAGVSEAEYDQLIDERVEVIMDFLKSALKPR